MAFDRLLLRTSPRWLTLEPADPAVAHETVLYIDRAECEPSLRPRGECAALAEPDEERVVFGVVGLVETLLDKYLVVVDKRVSAGCIMEEQVWKVSSLVAIPVRGPKMLKNMTGVNKDQRAEEAVLRSMLNAAVALPGFYFAHGFDLTRGAQKRADIGATSRDAPAVPDFARADLRFVWNRFAAKPLADLGIVSWIVPLILGYVDVREGLVNGKAVQLALIARRAADRPGLRFTARGADIHGNCSNFVETEQIISHGDAYSSYLQVRGSIPLLWKQEACIKYKPTPTLKEVDAGGKRGLCQTAFEKHFERLFATYGPVTAISLIDMRGVEGPLGSALGSAVDLMANAKLHYVPWDFHKKTKGMKYEQVDTDLVPSIEADLGAYSYFLSTDGTAANIQKRQKGVVRTNCIDSLDRTNVVQSVIAHRIMDDALKIMGVLNRDPDTCTAAKFDDFEEKFKNTWADHANALSQVYAGSGALKTDYTRTGKRTKPGMLQDGVRACMRYIYQNLLDGRRQDGIDLFLGVVTLQKSATGPRDLSAIKSKAEPLLVKEKFLPHVFVLAVSVGAFGLLSPRSWPLKIVLTGSGFGSAAFVFGLILRAGHKLVSRPTLDGTR